jgi:GGDEF domain-containing protein
VLINVLDVIDAVVYVADMNTMGHITGDRALTEIADILKETFREPDIIARIRRR